MTCKQVKEILSLYQDNILSAEESARVEKHLKRCKRCSRELSDLRIISSLLSQVSVPEPTIDLNSRIENRLSLCQQTREMLSLYEDDVLPLGEKAKIEEHLHLCDFCKGELDSLRSFRSLLREIPVPEPAADLCSRIESRIFQEEASKHALWRQRLIYHFRFAGASALGGLAVAVVFLTFVRLYTARITTRVEVPVPEVKLLPRAAVPRRAISTVPTVPEVPEKKEVVKIVKPEKLEKKEVIKIVKPDVLQTVAEFKTQMVEVTPAILTREASFTTLSFLPREEQIYSSLYNGNNLWLGLFSSPAKLIKVTPGVDNYVIYTCLSGDDNATSLILAGKYLWVGLDSVPFKILRFNPEDGSYVSYVLPEGGVHIPEGQGGIRNAACFDGKYLWFGLWTKPAKLVRVNPEDLSYTVYSCKEGESHPSFALYDGKNVWFGLYTSPAKYLKVNPGDGSYFTYNLKPGEDYIKTGVYDGKDIWFGLETKPGKLVKVNSEDGTYLVYNLREGENIVTAGTFARRYLWFTVSSEPTKILQVHPQTGNYIAYTRRDIRDISSASFDGKNLWFPDRSGKLLKVSL